MPQKIVCSKCNYTLYKGDILKSPSDIIKKYEGKCINCGKKLEFYGTNSVDITPVDENLVVSIERMNEKREVKRNRETNHRKRLTDGEIFEELYEMQKRSSERGRRDSNSSYKKNQKS